MILFNLVPSTIAVVRCSARHYKPFNGLTLSTLATGEARRITPGDQWLRAKVVGLLYSHFDVIFSMAAGFYTG